MTEHNKKKRSTASLLVAIPLLIAVGIVLVVMKVNSFFRKKTISVDDLKFPVLVIQPGGTPVFAEWEPVDLQKFSERSRRTPVNGTIIVDSDLNQYLQENVRPAEEGEIKAIGRILFSNLMRRKYLFDLKPIKLTGIDPLRTLLLAAPPFSDDPAEDGAMRSAAMKQTTLAGILDALKLEKPPEQTTLPTDAIEPTTEPSKQIEPDPDPKP